MISISNNSLFLFDLTIGNRRCLVCWALMYMYVNMACNWFLLLPHYLNVATWFMVDVKVVKPTLSPRNMDVQGKVNVNRKPKVLPLRSCSMCTRLCAWPSTNVHQWLLFTFRYLVVPERWISVNSIWRHMRHKINICSGYALWPIYPTIPFSAVFFCNQNKPANGIKQACKTL